MEEIPLALGSLRDNYWLPWFKNHLKGLPSVKNIYLHDQNVEGIIQRAQMAVPSGKEAQN